MTCKYIIIYHLSWMFGWIQTHKESYKTKAVLINLINIWPIISVSWWKLYGKWDYHKYNYVHFQCHGSQRVGL